MIELYCWVAALLCSGILLLQIKPVLSPGGHFYLHKPNTRPYVMRRLLPFLMQRAKFEAWHDLSTIITMLSGVLVGLYAQNAWITVMFMGLPLVRSLFRFPVLTDAPALFLFCLGLYLQNPYVMMLGGLFNEKVPIFGAVALWSFLPLAGLVVPLVLFMVGDTPDGVPEWLTHPFKAAWKLRRRLVDPNVMIWPWGSFLMGAGMLDLKGSLLLLAGYAQLLVAQDSARLFQWSFIAFVPGLLQFPLLLPGFAVFMWLNPFRDSL